MGLKQDLLKKLYFHITKVVKEHKIQNIIQGDIVIPKTAVIVNSKISGNVKIGEYVRIIGADIFGSQVEIGDYTTINADGSTIHSELYPVKIGKFCSIARKVDIQEINHHINRLSTSMINSTIMETDIRLEMASKGAINIGHDVWIGTQSVVLSGVTIGNGAIIGANSTVTGDVPPYSIVVGSPAKVIKYRFDFDTIKKIEELKWWDWSQDKLKQYSNLFNKNNLTTADIDNFINSIK